MFNCIWHSSMCAQKFFLYLFQDHVAENLVVIDDRYVCLEKVVCVHTRALTFKTVERQFILQMRFPEAITVCY